MGKVIPRSFEGLRSGEQIALPEFTNLAAATAAGVTAAKFPGRLVRFKEGGTGGVACLAVSDGSKWKQIAVGNDVI